MKERIISFLGEYVKNVIEIIILDFSDYDVDLQGISESYTDKTCIVEFTFKRGLSNNELNYFYKELENKISKEFLGNFDYDVITAMSGRVYLTCLK